MANLRWFEAEAAFGDALSMVAYVIRKALEEPTSNKLACEMADESVKVFTRKLVQAAREAGYDVSMIPPPVFVFPQTCQNCGATVFSESGACETCGEDC